MTAGARRPAVAMIAVALASLSACAHRARVSAVPGQAGARPSAVAETFRRQVLNAVDAGDGDIRVRFLRQKIAADPGDLAARLELASHYQEMRFPELALDHYRLAAAQFPDNAQVHLLLARSLRSLGIGDQAVDALAGFLARHPEGSAELLSWLGILNDELGRWPQAEKAHREALAKAPRQAVLENNLGYNLLLQGKPADAAPHFRRALALDSRSETARNNLGLALASQPASQPGEALLHWKSVADAATAHSNLAAVLIEQGNYAEARKQLEAALGYRQDHPSALRNLELVSQLDGGPAAIRISPRQGFWSRFRAALRKALVSSEEDKSARAVRTASR